MRPAQALGQVRQIGGKVGGDFQFRIHRADLVYVLHPALLRHLQAAAQADGEQSQTFGNDAGQYGRALAASGYEQAENAIRSEEHTSELQSLMRISYAVFCLKKKNNKDTESDDDDND